MPDHSKDNRLYQVALLVSLACVLQISESMIPHPIPGLRLGLANMITLTALYVLGFRHAMEIAVMRTVLSSLVMGSFMSPTFILSFCAAVFSTLSMGLFQRLSGICRWFGLSIVGVSILGAFAHNMAQLYLAYLILVKHEGVFVFLPWLSVGAVATGLVTGFVAVGVCRGIERMPRANPERRHESAPAGPKSRIFARMDTPVHRFPAEIKIFVIVALSLVILVFDNLWLYMLILVFLAVIAMISETSFVFLLSRVKKFSFLIALTFLLPVFLNAGGHVAFRAWGVEIASEGLKTGGMYAFRIVLLIMACALLARTTSMEDMTRGLASALRPLKWFGLDEKRAASILSLSWSSLPCLWETARQEIKKAKLHRAKNLRNLIPLLSELVAGLFLSVGPDHPAWKTADAKLEMETVASKSEKSNAGEVCDIRD